MSYETDIVIGSQPFNTLRESDFRRLIVSHTGVLPRMELESRSDVAISHATAISKSGDSEQVQVLLVTIVDFPTRATFLVVHWPDSERQMDIYSAQLQIAKDTGCLRTVIEHRIEPGNHQFVQTERFNNIVSVSNQLIALLSDDSLNRNDQFHATWTGDSLSLVASMRILLTEMIPMVRKLGRFDFYNPSTYSYR
jgi:hypothetical protein